MARFYRLIIIYILLHITASGMSAARPKKQPVDTVGLRCRGVMESFPKVYEGLEKRLEFYAEQGFTHYFYSPSDDRYCNRWGWKILYNDSDRHLVRNLNTLCHENNLEFVWTLDPGERYKWTPEDYKYLLDKLVMMYYNGIRSFAVSFSENEGNYMAVKDSLEKDFVATRPEKVSLYMIDETSVAEYPSEGASAVRSLMKGYHFDDSFVKNAKAKNSVICNISSYDEFAKIAVLSVADFARDPYAYSPDESMADAVEMLHGDIRQSFMTFLRHTGGVKESSDVMTFSLEDWSKEKSDSLFREFDRIEKVPLQMRKCTGSEIVDALEPWLVEFGRLGTRGKKVLKCMEYYKSGNLGDFWKTYLSTVMTEEEIISYESHPVGENKLHPFCNQAMDAMKKGFTSMLTGDTVLHNLASTLYAQSGKALDSDFATFVSTRGHMEFAIPAQANTCHLLTGQLPEDRRIIFRQLKTDGSLAAEYVLRSSYSTFDIKDGAVMVDILGDVDVYENIFVYL